MTRSARLRAAQNAKPGDRWKPIRKPVTFVKRLAGKNPVTIFKEPGKKDYSGMAEKNFINLYEPVK